MPLDRARFEARVDRSGLHHMWLGARSPGGGGQVRVDGKLLTAARAAWEIENGPVPDGVRVLSCADEPACVRVDHLRLDQRAHVRRHRHRRSDRREAPGRLPRSRPECGRSASQPASIGSGSVAARSAPSTALEKTRPQRWPRLSPRSATGTTLYARRDKQLTVDSLVAWYLEFAREDRGLDHSTLTGYADAYSHWLKEPIGHKRANSITTAELDKAFGRMRRAGLSRSRMNNARALLSGAFKWGKRHRKVTSNPVDGFELPTSTHTPRHTTAPELDELLRLLATADEHDELLAPVLKLAATTGLRRGELSGLRRDRLHLDRQELIVDTAINDAGGIVVEKQTKDEEQPSSQPRRGHRRSTPTAPCRDGYSGSRLWNQRCPGWFRVQPRPNVQHSPAPGTAHPPHAPTAQRARPHRQQLRRHNPRTTPVRRPAN